MAKQKGEKEKSRLDPRAEDRRRLKSLAFSRGLLSPSSSYSSPSLRPSATVLKHAGKDVVKKGHRKNRFLFSFPGFLSPIASGGKIGDLSDLATGNPILYLNFPRGRMKLFGTIVYPKNRYLTLQFARKNVLCEDSFDSLVVFSDAWWIGTEEENPQEAKLDFPKELVQETHVDLDFQGGIGGTARKRASGVKISNESLEPVSPVTELKGDISEDSNLDSSNYNTDKMQRTPVRQSARTSRKALSYAESSSEDEAMDGSASSDADKSDNSQEKAGNTTASISDLSKKTHPSNSKFAEVKNQTGEESKQLASNKNAEDSSSRNKSVLVQTTLSSLFEKVVEKTSKHDSDEQLLQKGSYEKGQRGNKKSSSSTRQKPVLTTKKGRGRKKSGTKTKPTEIEEEDEDDIEETSSDSEDMDESDEDWAA